MPQKPVEALLKEKKICEIVNPKLIQAGPDLSVREAVELMQKHRSGYIVIAQAKRCVGIFTETDLTMKILEKDIDWERPVRDFMTREPIVLSPQDSVGKAIDVMAEHRFYHIPLVEAGELVNVISVRTLIRFLAEFYPTEVYNLPPKPDQVMATPEGG